MDAIGRLKDACARARRPATHFLVADVRELIKEHDRLAAENEQLWRDNLDLIGEAAANV